ncbi:MAG: hypothetical protein J2P54_13715 [Bradyrhizobiaceae bacterium]|nr:hypothetical protein [Bradyrhizobiaceae bacterium]
MSRFEGEPLSGRDMPWRVSKKRHLVDIRVARKKLVHPIASKTNIDEL